MAIAGRFRGARWIDGRRIVQCSTWFYPYGGTLINFPGNLIILLDHVVVKLRWFVTALFAAVEAAFEDDLLGAVLMVERIVDYFPFVVAFPLRKVYGLASEGVSGVV